MTVQLDYDPDDHVIDQSDSQHFHAKARGFTGTEYLGPRAGCPYHFVRYQFEIVREWNDGNQPVTRALHGTLWPDGSFTATTEAVKATEIA